MVMTPYWVSFPGNSLVRLSRVLGKGLVHLTSQNLFYFLFFPSLAGGFFCERVVLVIVNRFTLYYYYYITLSNQKPFFNTKTPRGPLRRNPPPPPLQKYNWFDFLSGSVLFCKKPLPRIKINKNLGLAGKGPKNPKRTSFPSLPQPPPRHIPFWGEARGGVVGFGLRFMVQTKSNRFSFVLFCFVLCALCALCALRVVVCGLFAPPPVLQGGNVYV